MLAFSVMSDSGARQTRTHLQKAELWRSRVTCYSFTCPNFFCAVCTVNLSSVSIPSGALVHGKLIPVASPLPPNCESNGSLRRYLRRPSATPRHQLAAQPRHLLPCCLWEHATNWMKFSLLQLQFKREQGFSPHSVCTLLKTLHCSVRIQPSRPAEGFYLSQSTTHLTRLEFFRACGPNCTKVSWKLIWFMHNC